MKKFLSWVPWLLSIAVLVAGGWVWAQALNWQFVGIGTDGWFPLFGILAFSLMWVHYAVDFIERLAEFTPAGKYLAITRYLVLFFIIMHPGLLAYERWQQGFGFPPGSVIGYEGAMLALWVIVGIMAWVVFMGFELHHWYREERWFKFIMYATDAAMIAIVFHALKLGGEVQSGWFHYVWIFYAISLVVFILKAYYDNYRSKVW